MAHELSHIVLATLSHPERDNEFYTDLTAMVLGFADITKNGRHVYASWTSGNTTTTETTTYGYLTDSQFTFAYYKILTLLEVYMKQKNDVFNQLHQLRTELISFRKKFTDFQVFRDWLDKHVDHQVKVKDGLQIVHLHQPGHTDEHLRVLACAERAVSDSGRKDLEIVHHTRRTAEVMRLKYEEFSRIRADLATLSRALNEDVKVLRRNLPLFYRLKNLWADVINFAVYVIASAKHFLVSIKLRLGQAYSTSPARESGPKNTA
jgi:hypothetical protein